MQSQRQEGGGRLAGWYQGKDQIFSSRATALIQGSSNRTNKKDVDQIYSCQDGEKEQNITYRVFWGLWNPLEKVWCRFTYLAELNMSSFIDKNVIFTFQFMLLSSTGREEIFLMDMHKIYIDYNLQTAGILFDYNFKGNLNSLIVNFSRHCETPV